MLCVLGPTRLWDEGCPTLRLCPPFKTFSLVCLLCEREDMEAPLGAHSLIKEACLPLVWVIGLTEEAEELIWGPLRQTEGTRSLSRSLVGRYTRP